MQVWSHDGARSGHGSGGADRDRTGDPLLAKQALSQLSYSPSPQSPPSVADDETAGDPARTWC